jgi:hypothetical protein
MVDCLVIINWNGTINQFGKILSKIHKLLTIKYLYKNITDEKR